MTGSKQEKIFFPNLDGLRFFSFLIVFFAHSFSTQHDYIKHERWYQLIKVRMFSDGDIGVSFFFVLSGFLISYLLLKEKELNGTINVKSFYMRRVLRIWPLYYLIVLFGFLIFPVLKTYFGQVPQENADPLLCSTFLNNFDRIVNGKPDAAALGGLWTIAIEEQFYMLWPLLFFVTPVKHYQSIFIAVLVVSTLFRVFYDEKNVIDLHTVGVITDMAIGGLGAYLMLNNNWFVNRIEGLSRYSIVIAYALILIFLVFKKELFSNVTMLVLKRIILAGVFLVIILEQNYARNSLFKVGNWKMVSSLGKYTYGLYCFHVIGILISVTLLQKFSLNEHSWQLWLLEVPVSFAISVVLSWLSYRYFESWFLKLKSRFSSGKSESTHINTSPHA